MPEPLIKNQYPGAAAGPPGPPGPPGPDVTGDPNALLFINPAGNHSTTDPKLTAAPTDQYGRPQIRDIRKADGVGAVNRIGAWEVDGDAENVIGEGYVVYGWKNPAEFGSQNGMIGRLKYDKIYLRRIVGGVDIGYAFRVDLTSLYLKNDDDDKTFEVDRETGATRASAYLATGPAGSEAKWYSGEGSPEGAQLGSPGDLYSNRLGGSNTTLYVKESGSGTNTGWTAK